MFPVVDVLAWCLMPNHFHFLIHANEKTIEKIPNQGIQIQQFSESIRLLLSSYTKAINKQNNYTGNLFQQKTKAKLIDYDQEKHLKTIFHYIHQNPVHSLLVNKMEEWPFSSFKDYAGIRNGKLCNKGLAESLIGINQSTFYNDSHRIIDKDKLKGVF